MKTEWKKVRLGDIATFSNGINFGKESYSKGVKLITVSDFGDRYFPEYNELVEVDEKVLRPTDYLQNGDMVFVRSNGNKELVGRCMLIENPTRPVTYSGFCIRARLKNINENNPRFFTYYFKSRTFRRAMSNTTVGANIQNLNQGLLSNYELLIPDFETQQKIAGILSAYDDLIENNRKQIKLLEEVAQKLYKEWFVKLNFPGHENVKIVDGVPEGWKKVSIDKIYNIRYGKNLPTTEIQSNGKYPVYGANGIIGYYNISNCNQKVVLITSRGNGSGDVLCTKQKESFVTNNSFIVLPKQAYDYLQFSFIFGQMKSLEFRTIRTGSAQPQLTNNSISMLNIVYPNKELIIKYCNIAERYYEKIDSLDNQIKLLQSARDKLLTRLMNGEMVV